jgi:hypothetical protein
MSTGEVGCITLLDGFTFRRGRPVVQVNLLSEPAFFLTYASQATSATLVKPLGAPNVYGKRHYLQPDASAVALPSSVAYTFGWQVSNSNQNGDPYLTDAAVFVEGNKPDENSSALSIEVPEPAMLDLCFTPSSTLSTAYVVHYPTAVYVYHADVSASIPDASSVTYPNYVSTTYPFISYRVQWSGLELVERRPVVGLSIPPSYFTSVLGNIAYAPVNPGL